jgi:hypothetical protein
VSKQIVDLRAKLAEQSHLDKTQDLLLKKLIYFESLTIDHENDPIKQRLYKLFFGWPQPQKTLDSDKPQQEKPSARSEVEERAERQKRLQLKRETHQQEFLDNGGFKTVLNDIFCPTGLKSMELDSVY